MNVGSRDNLTLCVLARGCKCVSTFKSSPTIIIIIIIYYNYHINKRDFIHIIYKVHDEAGARSTTAQLNPGYADRLLYCRLHVTESDLEVHLPDNQLLHG
jgi:hypothetical protein